MIQFRVGFFGVLKKAVESVIPICHPFFQVFGLGQALPISLK